MNLVPDQFKVPALPQVNLMPPEVGQRRQRSRQRGIVVALFILALFVIGGMYVLMAYYAQEAQAEAAAEQSRTPELQAEIATYKEVDEVNAELLNSNSARQYAAGIEVFWPLMLSSLSAGLPEGAVLEGFSVNLPPFGESPTVPESPFGSYPVGLLTFTAEVTSVAEASAVENQLNTVPFFERARITGIAPVDAAEGGEEGGDEAAATTWIISGTVNLTYDALMFRYSPLWFGEPEGAVPLENYYQTFYAALLAGDGAPSTFPPLPEATPPPLVPGQVPGSEAIVEPSVSPSPSEEASA